MSAQIESPLDTGIVRCLVIAVAFAIMGSSQAISSDSSFDAKVFGHTVEILANPSDKYGERVLKIDDHEFQKNYILSIDEIGTVGGVGIAIGSSSGGGNMCDASPFVISFPPQAKPQFDGPIDSCNSVSWEVLGDHIQFQTGALPLAPGQSWVWKPNSGFRAGPKIDFKANEKKGWNDLRSRTVNHPSELFSYAEVAKQIYARLGSNAGDVVPLIEGVGSGEFDGDLYVGSGCRPHACTDASVLVVANISTRAVFVSWKLEKRPIAASPKLTEWPDAERLQFEQWKSHQ